MSEARRILIRTTETIDFLRNTTSRCTRCTAKSSTFPNRLFSYRGDCEAVNENDRIVKFRNEQYRSICTVSESKPFRVGWGAKICEPRQRSRRLSAIRESGRWKDSPGCDNIATRGWKEREWKMADHRATMTRSTATAFARNLTAPKAR